MADVYIQVPQIGILLDTGGVGKSVHLSAVNPDKKTEETLGLKKA